eukprot:gnl/MRDRNA2_/MRDRNA2_80511_c0_seq2.p1 gnl/MRDRNA2_/MRDRNA2_80511_c0~~gnl/MRDRNA2_/MRDRNA2_80511_c0_seq2.p1  ORF type:complete len:355 (+),score=72.62 gnl/MRDRNA2_/MRDRNA2_80511_c0_seq2:156-1220(+)
MPEGWQHDAAAEGWDLEDDLGALMEKFHNQQASYDAQIEALQAGCVEEQKRLLNHKTPEEIEYEDMVRQYHQALSSLKEMKKEMEAEQIEADKDIWAAYPNHTVPDADEVKKAMETPIPDHWSSEEAMAAMGHEGRPELVDPELEKEIQALRTKFLAGEHMNGTTYRMNHSSWRQRMNDTSWRLSALHGSMPHIDAGVLDAIHLASEDMLYGLSDDDFLSADGSGELPHRTNGGINSQRLFHGIDTSVLQDDGDKSDENISYVSRYAPPTNSMLLDERDGIASGIDRSAGSHDAAVGDIMLDESDGTPSHSGRNIDSQSAPARHLTASDRTGSNVDSQNAPAKHHALADRSERN